MATDTATRNITENEWTQFKPAILRVLQMKSKKTLSETMMKEHNFIATAAQYEHRLNKWKIRSYLTVFEWKVILPIVDRLKARSMLSRILLSGVVLNDGRISRGRKQCNNDQRQPLSRQESRYSPLDQVAIEIQRSDGSWTPLSPSDGDSFYIFRQARGKRNSIQKHVTRTRELAFTGPVESRSEHPVPRRVQHCDFVERTTIIPQISSSPPGRYSVVAFSPSASLTLHDEISEEWMDQSCSFQAEDISIVSESFRQCEPWKVGSNQFGSLQTASHVFNTSFDPSRLCECMFPDLSNPFQLSVFNNRRYGWMEDIRRQALVLLRLSQKDVDSEIMSLDGITSANVMNFIIFSVANGFSELNEIPDQDISNYIQKPDHLEFLSRHLESCSSHVRKSLVNNLLKSAIGAEDVRAVKRLLDFGLIRPDDIIGGFGTPKSHYAVHCAIHLHNQQLLEVFVQAGAKCDDCCMHLLLRRTLSRLKPHLTPPMGPMSDRLHWGHQFSIRIPFYFTRTCSH
ncbi:hypothetical protein F5Y16DRAFT_250570 [Xylariaceae sp. FL0255]|nr:hypothetical protein F5Y16DRAFT_250570 [Xylariaceae sp. FL0255]